MPKTILIIGGGISGLALLHFLKNKYSHQPETTIHLIEKSDRLGGTIQTIQQNGCLFEAGPNGFLSTGEHTLSLVKQLNLESSLITASEDAAIRYIRKGEQLHPVPFDFDSFLETDLLNWRNKFRVAAEIFCPRGQKGNESVYDFAKRRLGKAVAENFIDPMVSGIYAGDARDIVLREAFPKMSALEERYGSLFKAILQKRREYKLANPLTKEIKREAIGMPRGRLTSFQSGMSELIETIGKRYSENIHLQEEVQNIMRKENKYILQTKSEPWIADEIFLCTPAYAAAALVQTLDASLAHQLNQISYAPVAVVGCVYSLSELKIQPKGFGYLVPSSENRQTLGVLFESNIFSGRVPEGKIMLRVMLGGVRHPEILAFPKKRIVNLARIEIESSFLAQRAPDEIFVKVIPKAIPQYDYNYAQIKPQMEIKLKSHSQMHLAANYWGGVSLNDCVKNASQTVDAI